MISITVLNKESGQKITIGAEETMTIQAFLQRLRAKEMIDPQKPYYLKTKADIIHPPLTTFQQVVDREFILVQDLIPPPPPFLQLGIFVIDGSGSMTEGEVDAGLSPAMAVNEALKSTISYFQQSSKKDCFSFAVVAFGDSAEMIQPPQKVATITGTSNYFIATDYFNDKNGSTSTNISSGLVIAGDLAKKFLSAKTGSLIHHAVIVLLTDGICHHEPETRAVAARLNQVQGLEICSCHLETGQGKPDAKQLLKDISKHYEIVYNKETIRNFFIQSSTRINRG